MANKLGQGDAFPHLTLNLVGGEKIDLLLRNAID